MIEHIISFFTFTKSSMYFYLTGFVVVMMLIWNTIEVGRNDAANIVNAVFGARVMRRKKAVRIAGLAVIIGACASSGVMETARKGIFDPEYVASTTSIENVLAIYIAVYLTSTVILYSFSAYGMPISTTACLVFALMGGGLLGGGEAIHWNQSGIVIAGIVCSILISGCIGFWVQRAFRGAIGQDCTDADKVRLHGPWISGALLTGLIFFILMKGMQHFSLVNYIETTFHQYLQTKEINEEIGIVSVLFILWCMSSLAAWLLINFGGDKVRKNLFSGMAVLGMIAIAIAFGQNDLANCASPGVASWMILKQGAPALKADVHFSLLLFCGFLLAVGMMTRTAQRVTRAEVNTGSQGDVVRLYAPQWCINLAKRIAPSPHPDQALAPEPELEAHKKLQHYDALRAAVITSVSASVIAFASGMKLPVSTTYVSFVTVISTGWADRIFMRGDAHLKLGRTIWVVFCWFFSAFLSAVTTGICAWIIIKTGWVGILIGLIVNMIVRYIMKIRSDAQELRMQQEANQRKQSMLHESGRSTDQELLFATDADSDNI